MGKFKKKYVNILSYIMVILLLISNFGVTASAKSMRRVTIPTPAVAGVNSNYETGDVLKLSITASGSTKVQYKVTLVNETTKKTYNITNGFAKTAYNPKTPYAVSYKLTEQGKYTLSVSSKIQGASDKSCKTVAKTFNVWDKSVIISSVEPITKTVNIEDTVELPATVTAKMKDGSSKEIAVVWDKTSVDTTKLGTQTISGTLKGYTYKVTLTVNVVNEKIILVDDINASVDEGSEYKLPETVTAHLSNGTTKGVSVKWSADSVDTARAGTYTYLGDVEGYKNKAKLTVAVNAVPFTVSGITSTNLKETTVVFSKKIDISTVMTNNFRIYRGSSYIPTTPRLLSDDKTVVLSVTASGWSLDNSTLYSLVVENVKDLSGKKIERTIKDFTANDNITPDAVSVSASSPSNINVVFNEPIKNTSTGTIEVRRSGSLVSTSTAYSGFDTNTINVSINSNMAENIQYDVTVKGFKDFMGTEIAAKTLSFVYKKDTSAVTASVKSVSQTYAVIKFNKPVIWLTKEHFYHTNAAYTPLGIYKNPEMTDNIDVNTPVDTVWVKFYDDSTQKGHPITSDTQKIVILGKANSYEISDNFGNKFSDAELPVRITVDNTPVSVASLKQDTDTSLYVEFNKEVAFTSSNIDIIDKDGNKVYITSVTDIGGGYKYRVSINKITTNPDIIITIKNVIDKNVSLNKLDTYTSNLTITDKTPPQVQKVTKKFITGLDQCIYVLFNEPVNNTALNISNYYLQNPTEGTMRNLTKTPVFENGDKMVKIDLTDDEKSLVDSGYNLFVKDVQDKNNNPLPGQIVFSSKFVSYDSADSKPKVLKVEATARNTVAITFDQYLKYIDIGAFMVNGAAPSSINVSTDDDGNTVVTLTANSGTESYSSNGIWLVYMNPSSTNKVQNSFGLSADMGYFTSTSTIKIVDKIPPQVNLVNGVPQVSITTTTGGIIDSVIIEYDDDIDMTKLSALSYTVDGRSIKKVYTNTSASKTTTPVTGRFVVIELKTDGTTTTDMTKSPSVIQVLDIYDMNDNKLAPDGKVLSLGSYSGPIVTLKLSAQINPGQSAVIKFSQDLNEVSKTVVQNAVTVASRGKGILTYSWTTNSMLIITNTSPTYSTDFNLSAQTTVNITDVNGKTTSNAVIIGQ